MYASLSKKVLIDKMRRFLKNIWERKWWWLTPLSTIFQLHQGGKTQLFYFLFSEVSKVNPSWLLMNFYRKFWDCIFDRLYEHRDTQITFTLYESMTTYLINLLYQTKSPISYVYDKGRGLSNICKLQV